MQSPDLPLSAPLVPLQCERINFQCTHPLPVNFQSTHPLPVYASTLSQHIHSKCTALIGTVTSNLSPPVYTLDFQSMHIYL